MASSRKLLSIILIASLLFCNILYLNASAVGTSYPGASAVLAQGNSAHNLFLQRDGTVWAWGDNERGQLGDGTTINRSTPVQVKDPSDPTGYIQNVVQVSIGSEYSLALKKDGSVWTWGAYNFGTDTLALKKPIQIKAPEDPTGNLSQIVYIASESTHALALRKDGTLWGIGSDYNAVQGFYRNSNTAARDAYKVPNLANVLSVATTDDFSAVLKSDGSVWAFGDLRGVGELHGSSEIIKQVKDAEDSTKYLTGVVKMFGSGNCIAFVKNNGIVKILTSRDSNWTSLTAEDKITVRKLNFFPAEKGILDDAVSMSFSSGFKNCLVCRKDGSVWVWSDQVKEAADITPTNLKKVPGIQGAIEVKAEVGHCMALTKDGTIYTWGSNFAGQLGDGTLINKDTPVAV
ncbi:MAG TPA: hypothetical protein VHT34_08325, partial [Clostridia bacterium]|nr:hypothetical protein [Clostridia bacterium]